MDPSAAQLGLPSAENQPAQDWSARFCVWHINEEFRDERNFRMNDVVTSLLPSH